MEVDIHGGRSALLSQPQMGAARFFFGNIPQASLSSPYSLCFFNRITLKSVRDFEI
jgi:hypothetical protein